MSAPDPTGTSQPSLLLVIEPAARQWDGESVRIARDVLCAGAPGVKVCLPEGPEEAERALCRRGSRRPVLVGDDTALLRAVRVLHRERELDEAELSVVPVGAAECVALACGLGVPADAVSAARTVLAGAPHRLGLLIDDSGGVVLGGLSIPGPPRRRTLSMRSVRGRPPAQRLRVEADGELLADLDEPVREVSVTPAEDVRGLAQVTVRPGASSQSELVRVRARAVTVSGANFRYRADTLAGGPVRVRTWTALAEAWSLTLPG